MNNIDLKKLITNDDIGFEPDPAIQQRLQYHILLKSKSKKLYFNPLPVLINSLFSLRNMGVKAGVIGMIILFSVWIGSFSDTATNLNMRDTTMLNVTPTLFDTTTALMDSTRL